MYTIYVVEDDIDIRQLIVYALNNNGFKAMGFPDAQGLYGQMAKEAPSLLILDLMLDGESGYDILSRIRKDPEVYDLPVIILTAKSSEYDKVKGLDMGADDYITKPFGVLEMISRVKALLRRSPDRVKTKSKVTYKDLRMDLEKRQVDLDGKKLDLTYKEFELLYFLILNEGIVLSRDSLMEEVWGFDYSGETRTVDVHIRSLRQKLEDRDYIKTVRNVGYRLGD